MKFITVHQFKVMVHEMYKYHELSPTDFYRLRTFSKLASFFLKSIVRLGFARCIVFMRCHPPIFIDWWLSLISFIFFKKIIDHFNCQIQLSNWLLFSYSSKNISCVWFASVRLFLTFIPLLFVNTPFFLSWKCRTFICLYIGNMQGLFF